MTVVVSAGLEGLSSVDVRLLDEASRLGRVHVRLWSDRLLERLSGLKPRFSEAERRFFVRNLRYVDSLGVVGSLDASVLPVNGRKPDTLIAFAGSPDALQRLAADAGLQYLELGPERLSGWPDPVDGRLAPSDPAARRVLVTGCFDWLHSGHVEFFRDAAALGELYVVAGSDRNVRLLKGDGHPLHHQDQRVYMIGAMRPVHRALVSTGSGWMDAEPEIDVVKPHIYLVNEDGDNPEKREFCNTHGLEYLVLKRRPHRGLPPRTSTDLRGF
jgi:cytidyltransferase-like protein